MALTGGGGDAIGAAPFGTYPRDTGYPGKRRGEMIETEVEGELVALHIDNGTCYGFNSTATRIWAMIEQPRLLSELTEELIREYDVDPARAKRSSGSCWTSLPPTVWLKSGLHDRDRGLLEPRPSSRCRRAVRADAQIAADLRPAASGDGERRSDRARSAAVRHSSGGPAPADGCGGGGRRDPARRRRSSR